MPTSIRKTDAVRALSEVLLLIELRDEIATGFCDGRAVYSQPFAVARSIASRRLRAPSFCIAALR